MKTYKYKVQGVDYEVEIAEVEGKIAHVNVNGIPFEIEMQKPINAAKHPALAATKRSASTAAPVAAPVAAPQPAPKRKGGRQGERGRCRYRAGGHEDAEQHRGRICRYHYLYIGKPGRLCNGRCCDADHWLMHNS